LRYTGCNIVILMAATAWQMLSFRSCILCGFDSYTALFKVFPQKIYRVYLNVIRRAQLWIDAAGNHLQHLSAFGYCINFCIYAMLRTRTNFSWPILYFSSFIGPRFVECFEMATPVLSPYLTIHHSYSYSTPYLATLFLKRSN